MLIAHQEILCLLETILNISETQVIGIYFATNVDV